jgi:hypothetical protein
MIYSDEINQIKSNPIWTLLYVSFKHILMSLTNFMGIRNSIRMLYNTSPSLNHRLS